MKIEIGQKEDIPAWLRLAREVEHLFGPMADEPSFHEALNKAIEEERAFCVRADDDGPEPSLCGGVVVEPEENEIGWLAVSAICRRSGVGNNLLLYALGRLSGDRRIRLSTFDESVPEGMAARRLYTKHGFQDQRYLGHNPAGKPIVLMVRPRACESEV